MGAFRSICRLCRCCHYAAPLTHLRGCFSEILLVGFRANPCIVSSRDKTISRACLLSLWRPEQSNTLKFLTVIFIFSCSTKLLELIFFCMLTHDSRHFDAALYILHLEIPMLDISMQRFSFCILINQFKTFLCGKVHFAC